MASFSRVSIITSRRIASHCIASHRIASHRIASQHITDLLEHPDVVPRVSRGVVVVLQAADER